MRQDMSDSVTNQEKVRINDKEQNIKMADNKTIIDNPDTGSQRRSDRVDEMRGWDKKQGRLKASEEGIELTDRHWEVVYCLREYYLHNGPAENGRELGDMLDSKFADRGGRKYLRHLFPRGPVAQGMHIAGLEVPPHTQDEGFGTSR
jgi:tRNA 2-thiouridine synthesizing protein E